MEIVGRFVREFFGSFMAVRFVVSLVTSFIILTHAVLSLTGRVISYTDLASQLRLTPMALLILTYLLVAILMSLPWYFLVGRQQAQPDVAGRLRLIYRQTDATGLGWFDGLMLAAIVIGLVFVQRYFTHTFFLPAAFLAALAVLPTLLGLLPVRPRRAIVPEHGRTLMEIAHHVSRRDAPEDVVQRLIDYNELSMRNGQTPDTPLPEGMMVEIPPHF